MSLVADRQVKNYSPVNGVLCQSHAQGGTGKQELEQDLGGSRMASKAEKKLVQRSVKVHDALGNCKNWDDERRVGQMKLEQAG